MKNRLKIFLSYIYIVMVAIMRGKNHLRAAMKNSWMFTPAL